MGQELQKWKRRKNTLQLLNDIENKQDNVLIIHYSCESFYNTNDGRTPRITSVVIRNFATGQTASFSIHKSAEQMGALYKEINERYDEFEKHMLDEYFDFIKSRHGFTFVHWNMRDINYGFQAIEHRYSVLNGVPIIIDDMRKFDLARALVAIYGVAYISHQPGGRLQNLVSLNNITMKDSLTGAEEANAFENKEFVKLHQSTLRKADILANILERVINGSIKTNATWWQRNGIHPSILIEIITKHWGWALLSILATIFGLVNIFIDF